MIKTSKQLKDKVRNISKSDSTKAQMFIRNYMMERFLERIFLSKYRDNFVLKGGMLVAAVIGLETRTTMDMDTTLQSLPLTLSESHKVVEEIIHLDVPDGVSFRITKFSDIMEGNEYPGIRFLLEASLDNLRQAIKVDISTGDVITPQAVRFSYKLMFEDRHIPIWAYNLETILSEKLETIMSRSTANTRMRDFYDIYSILHQESDHINPQDVRRAFHATCEKRKTSRWIPQIRVIIEEARKSASMQKSWEKYKDDSYLPCDLEWNTVLDRILTLIDRMEL